MNFGFFGKMRAALIILVVALAFSSLGQTAMAGTEEEEEEWPELKIGQYDDMAVRNFIYARIYEAESRVEDNEKNLLFDESLTYDPVFKYKDDFISVDYIIGKFDNILEVMPKKFVTNAIYLKDRNKYHLLSRLGINPNMESEEISARYENLHVKLKFNKEILVEVYVVIDSLD